MSKILTRSDERVSNSSSVVLIQHCHHKYWLTRIPCHQLVLQLKGFFLIYLICCLFVCSIVLDPQKPIATPHEFAIPCEKKDLRWTHLFTWLHRSYKKGPPVEKWALLQWCSFSNIQTILLFQLSFGSFDIIRSKSKFAIQCNC